MRTEDQVAPPTMFPKGTVLRHVRTQVDYYILLSPACGLLFEETCTPAYAYQKLVGGTIWVRSAEEMEDGRFIPVI